MVLFNIVIVIIIFNLLVLPISKDCFREEWLKVIAQQLNLKDFQQLDLSDQSESTITTNYFVLIVVKIIIAQEYQ